MPGKSEHVLLADPVVGRILFIGISCGIMLCQNPLHPDIDGKCIRVVKTEKRHSLPPLFRRQTGLSGLSGRRTPNRPVRVFRTAASSVFVQRKHCPLSAILSRSKSSSICMATFTRSSSFDALNQALHINTQRTKGARYSALISMISSFLITAHLITSHLITAHWNSQALHEMQHSVRSNRADGRPELHWRSASAAHILSQ